MTASANIVQNSIRDILDVVFRHKFKLVLFCTLVVVAVVAYNLMAAPVYRSEAKVLIRRGRENVSVDPSVEGSVAALVRNGESEVYSELAVLKSRQLTEMVVDALGAEAFLGCPSRGVAAGRGPSQVLGGIQAKAAEIVAGLATSSPLTPREAAVKRLAENTAVEVERKSNIITVSFEAQDRDLAHDALDRLVTLYQDRHIEIHAAKADPGFFEGQVNDLKAKLTAAEEHLAAFRREHGVSSLDLQTEALLAQTRDLEGMIDDASAKMNASQAQVAALEEALEGESQTVELSRITGVTNWAADDYKKRLADLRLEEADLAARYSDSYRPLVELRERIDQLEATLADEGDTHTQVTTGINENREKLELELDRQRAEFDAQEARLTSLTARLGNYEGRHAGLAAQKVELESLERDVKLAEDEYRKYRDNWEESKISVALDKKEVSNVSLVQPATKPLDPVRPKKARNIALGVLLGLLGGIGLAFSLDYLDDSLKKDSDVMRRLGLPVLASISDKEFKACI